MTVATTLLTRLDAGDRALFRRWAIDGSSAGAARPVLTLVTHLGGAASSLALALLPVAGTRNLRPAGWRPFAALAISHLIVQCIKRTTGRPRPSRALAWDSTIIEPDQFSFPSGHAAAAMSIAVVYGALFPALAAPMVVIAAVIGLTRVFLGVHFPGDVLAGQFIGAATALVVHKG